MSRPGMFSPASESSAGRLSVRSEKCRKASCFWPMSTKAALISGFTFWTFASTMLPSVRTLSGFST